MHNDIPPQCQDRKKFYCDQCPKIFFSELAVKGHFTKVHTDKKLRKPEPIKSCPHCEKTFASYGNYLEHFRVMHEKVLLLDCELCTRKFGTKGKLNEHVKNVHTPVNCEICGQKVCNNFMLKRHKAKAHDIIPENWFSCNHCSLMFKTEKRLQNHLQNKHSNI